MCVAIGTLVALTPPGHRARIRDGEADTMDGKSVMMALGIVMLAAGSAAAGRGDDIQLPRAVELTTARSEHVAEIQTPRGQDIQTPRGEDIQTPRGQDIQTPRGEDIQTPRGQDIQTPRGEDGRAPRGGNIAR